MHCVHEGLVLQYRMPKKGLEKSQEFLPRNCEENDSRGQTNKSVFDDHWAGSRIGMDILLG